MRKLIKHFIWTAALLLTVASARAFVTGGPIGNGGDNWQVPVIGYGLPGDLLAPKNIGEEYRRVTPTMYYAYDANFFGFFGLAGATNIDIAFGVMNSLTNVSNYSFDLSEFPLESQQYNYTAQSLGLLDLKSVTLALLVEQMGLGEPERYIWTLHDRYQPSGTSCPNSTTYLVVQRNFDIVNSPLNQVQYSPYVNGTLFTYQILENCTGPNPLASTIPINTDPFANVLTPVADFALDFGGYYTTLTRDDVAGLRYLLSSNNVNYEATAPSGGLLLTSNVQATITLTTLPFSLLFAQSLTNDPATLTNLYPGLTFLSVQTNIGVQITTNITAYFTNQSALPVFSNSVAGGLPTTPTITNIYYFTNQPGPTVINYDLSYFLQIPTLDLATFSDSSRTNDPATMLALYPGLQILRVIANPAIIYVTNYIAYLTNSTGAPYTGGSPILKIVAISTNSYFGTNFTYTFGNVFTNHAYTNRLSRTQNIWITNQIGAPYGSPLIALTNYTTTNIVKISGDFFIIPTNWCGFEVIQVTKPNINPPYAFGPTNTLIFNGYSTNGPTGTNNVAGGNAYGLTQNISDIYTNYILAVRPGICQSVLVFGTNYATNIVTTYNYYFGNIVTNTFFTNTFNTILTTNIGFCPGGSPDQLCTNVTITSFYNNQLSGDFFIPSPAWCSYTILSTQLKSVVYTTNTITATNLGTGGQSYTQTTISIYTNTTFLIQPTICGTVAPTPALRQGIERIQFIRANYDSLIGQFFQPLTNRYSMTVITNGQRVTEFYERVITRPDFLMSAQDLNGGPSTVPVNPYVARNLNFDQSTILTGLAGPGTIIPATTFTFNKAGRTYFNVSPAFMSETNATVLYLWGSFDGSTNDPVVYPNGTSIANLQNQIVLQVTPSTLADGTVGTAYPAVTFTATGGQPPYSWSAANVSAQVPGMTVSGTPANATLSGTPTAAGVFNFTMQLTDSVNRIYSRNYTLTIH